jgi:hypothetical protein
MVEWADKIDSARYDSVEEAILGDAPALQIRASLMLDDRNPEYGERLLRALRSCTLGEVSQLPEVRTRSAQVRLLMEAGLDRFRSAVRLAEREIVVFDVNGEGVMISRYAPYFFFPQARYSAGIVRTKEGAKITAMRNPWRHFSSAPLGKIFSALGGGGHQRVGALLLPGGRGEDATQILEVVLQEIRQQDFLLQVLRPTA